MPGQFGEREQRLIPVRRVVAGVLLTSLLLPLVFVMAVPILLFGNSMGHTGELLAYLLLGGLTILGYMVLATLAPIVVFGLPLYALYRRKGWYRVGHYLVGGAIVGLAYAFALGAWYAEWRTIGFSFMPAMMLGAVAAFIFWLIVVWRSPRVTPVEEISRIFA